MTLEQNLSPSANDQTSTKELLSRLALHLMKERLALKQLTSIKEQDAKDMKETLEQTKSECQKIWRAFQKFISDQVCNKNRLVDTVLIGLFAKDSSGNVEFTPSHDYLAAANLKLPSPAILLTTSPVEDDTLIREKMQTYRQTYAKTVAVSCQ